MVYPQKIKLALDILAAAGVSRQRAASPVHKLLWSLGVQVRPPLFNGFFANFLFLSAGFGVVFTTLLAGFNWFVDLDWSIGPFAMQCAFTTIAYSLVSAALVQRRAGKLNLPDWSEIGVAGRFD